ncbi:MAG: undecaprenyldiphospho-muramoylpentapeptide beta-N-acetylglucosaminyltransferase [Gammaproteobacteria bacterium]|nr:undecaprenyldiphospho-muramoylpentapeptide beta-N-acetylglucosaminyltransferase [Gammaproteobacteria bacterium]
MNASPLKNYTPMRILIMAGGTGGHVFPALAVANELRAQGAEIIWMGTRSGLEAQIVPKAGIQIEWVSISGLRGKGLFSLVLAPFRLLIALSQALKILMYHRPMVVLGMGGFVAGPGGLVAWLLRKPLVIHEQNAVAGMTNRLLAHVATKVVTAFPDVLPDAIHLGNPVRAEISRLPEPKKRFENREGALRLLVIGGSLGAAIFNEVVPAALALLAKEQGGDVPSIDVWHQAGSRNIEEAQSQYRKMNVKGRIEAFIDDMAAAYAWADVVLCRAGALTVSELAAAGVASILVPYPYAVDDHQTHNANYLVSAGGGKLLPQNQLSSERLCQLIGSLDRVELLEMAQTARNMAKLDATQSVASLCRTLAEEGVGCSQGGAQ